MDSIQDLLTSELKNLYALEKQIWDATSDWKDQISNKHLAKRVKKQAKYSEKNFQAVHHLLQSYSINPSSTTDSVAEEMITNLHQIQNQTIDADVKHAGFLSSLQRLVHYQLACFKNCREIAKRSKQKSVKNELKSAEKRAEKQIKKLTELGKEKLYSN